VKLPFKRGDVLSGLPITDLTAEGHGIARLDRAVVFVEGAVPGDVVDALVRKTRKNYGEAVVQNLVSSSPDRTDPLCTHFGTCGGCKMQHINYSRQLMIKQKAVIDAFERIGKLEFPETEPILGSASQYEYRNRLDFAASDKRWLTTEEIASGAPLQEPALGFHIPGRFDKILDVDRCHLQEDLSNRIRNFIRTFAIENGWEFFHPVTQEGFLRNVIIRSTSTGEWMVIVVFRSEDALKQTALLEKLKQEFPEITSLLYIINGKRNDTIFDQEVHCFSGRDHILEQMEGLTFKISAKSFYQTNSAQAYELYKIVRDYAALTGTENVYDLYTGTGTIAQFVARHAKRVAGIDYIEDAIRDAAENAQRNGIRNVHFEAGDLKDTLTEEFMARHGKPDVVITDPPRAGMHPDVTERLLKLEPKRIVYVSCNPTTQARDIQNLSGSYSVRRLRPVDMFPNTMHVESVALLELKQS
jgi:23S rRNA (uracil1939-C5)-methyltransferase